MSGQSPLGSYAAFRNWRGRRVPWGAAGSSSAAFGGEVLPALTAGIRAHGESVRALSTPSRTASALALGCVPWLTSHDVVDALMGLDGLCVVVDKGASVRGPVLRIHRDGAPLTLGFLPPEMRDLAPVDADGHPRVLGPWAPSPENEVLEAVRVAGWRQDDSGRLGPLLHAKMLVLAIGWEWEDDEEWTGMLRKVELQSVWLGSANWTDSAAKHLEVGVWSTDRQLTREAWRFLADVLAFSEPLSAATRGPEPDLLPVQFDDEAIMDYLAFRDGDLVLQP